MAVSIRTLTEVDLSRTRHLLSQHLESSLPLLQDLEAGGLTSGWIGALQRDHVVAVAALSSRGIIFLQAPRYVVLVAQPLVRSGCAINGLAGPWTQVQDALSGLRTPGDAVRNTIHTRLLRADLASVLRRTSPELMKTADRRLTSAERNDLAELSLQASSADSEDGLAFTLRRATIERAERSELLRVLRHNGRWVSCCFLGSKASGALLLTDVFTHPTYRDRGFARQLLGSVLHEARQRGMDCVVVELDEANRAAASVYGELGFVDVGDYGRLTLDETSVRTLS